MCKDLRLTVSASCKGADLLNTSCGFAGSDQHAHRDNGNIGDTDSSICSSVPDCTIKDAGYTDLIDYLHHHETLGRHQYGA